MARIITVTANTAIDFSIEADGLALGDNIQATGSIEFTCGKGINVAKTIASMDTPVTCLGFVGRQSLGAFNKINSQWLHTDFTVVDGKTRTNFTLFDAVAKQETHIRTPGFTVTPDDCRQLIEKLDSTAVAGDCVILAGSLPIGAPDSLYQTLIELCHSKSAMPFLDSSGAGLRESLKARPHLIKPNQQELEEIMGQTLADEQAIVTAARSTINQGIDWIYVSRGRKGVVVVSDNVALAARANKIPGKALTHIGCGDAMVAGLAVATQQGLELAEIVRFAMACSTANLFSFEPGRIDTNVLPELLAYIEIRRL